MLEEAKVKVHALHCIASKSTLKERKQTVKSKTNSELVNSREAYRHDHHRNLFGTDKATPFNKAKNSEWQTSNAGSYAYKGDGSNLPTAGGGQLGDTSKMQFLTTSQRDTGVEYRGIKHTDD